MFELYCANCIGLENNCLYPNRVAVSDAASLAAAVGRDYVCAEYRDSYRSNANFLSSNCLALDFDNDHSDDPHAWVYPEDMRKLHREGKLPHVMSGNRVLINVPKLMEMMDQLCTVE